MQRLISTRPLLGFLVSASLAWASPAAASAGQASEHIRVDAFGYEAFESKVAVLRQAVVGFDAPDSFAPGPSIQLVRDADGLVVFERRS